MKKLLNITSTLVLFACLAIGADDSTDLTTLKLVIGNDFKNLIQGGTLPNDIERGNLARPYKIVEWRDMAAKAKAVANEAIRESDSNNTPANATGALSAVGKASLASLVGVALERGGLTQSGQKTAGTVSSNLFMLFCKSFGDADKQTGKEFCYPGANPLKNITFSISFKDQQEQSSLVRPLEAVSAASTRWELFNRRDPRRQFRSANFTTLKESLQGFAEAASKFDNSFEQTCKNDAIQLFVKKTEVGVKDEAALLNLYRELDRSYDKCSQKGDATKVLAALGTYGEQLAKVQADAKRSWVLAATYDFVRQTLPTTTTAVTDATAVKNSSLRYLLATTNPSATATTTAVSLPSLSTIGVTWESGQYSRFKYSGSFVVTAFNNAPAGSMTGLRDYRLTNELEFKLVTNSSSLAKGLTFSLAGIYLDLQREPLGQKVLLFGKTVTSPGKMGVVQGKLTLPGGSSGVKIPLSISYATRTELLPDKEWRAGLGFTFNWRQLI